VQNLTMRPAGVPLPTCNTPKSFDQPSLIGPCLHTICNQDLMVPLSDGRLSSHLGRLDWGGLFLHRHSAKTRRGGSRPISPSCRTCCV